MIVVEVQIENDAEPIAIDSWFRESGCLLYGVIPNLNQVPFVHGQGSYAVVAESTHHHSGRGSLRIEFTEDLSDLATLFKLTWGGK